MAAACLLPGSALAIEYRTALESFGSNGIKSGDVGSNSFSSPSALGFDQGTKHLYVLNGAEIHAFDSSTLGSHAPLGGTFPLSVAYTEPTDIAANSSSHNFYYPDPGENELFGFSESGAALAGFPIGGHNYPCGTAVDSAGNVWVSEGNEGKVQKYSPAGALIETISIGGEPCHLAFDAEDNLYVGFYLGSTVKYNAASGYTSSTTIDSEFFTRALTVDKATGEVFVVHYDHVSVWDTGGEFLYEFGNTLAGAGYGGVAIDEATEEAYVSDFEHGKVQVFGPPAAVPKTTTEAATGVTTSAATVHGTVNPKGLAVEDCRFEVIPAKQFITSQYSTVTATQKYPCTPAPGSIPVDSNPHAVSASPTGLEPATVYHYRLVAKNSIGEGLGTDRSFTTGAVAPLVEETSVVAVGSTDATVSANVNPRGGQTTYHVEYGPTAAYGQSSAESAPFGFPADNGKHAVSVHIGGLAPGTAYHFRFVADNEIATTNGADTTFATYPATDTTFAPCPNDQFRTGAGARLPDCRAYEQATPIDKHGANAQITDGVVSSSGDRVTFVANGGLPVSGGNSDLVPYLASRGPDGWSMDGFLPPTEPGELGSIFGTDEDLSSAFVSSASSKEVSVSHFFLRDSATAVFHPVFEATGIFGMELKGFADDPSHLVFAASAGKESPLLPGVPALAKNLYDLDHGTLSLVSRIPSGSATTCDDEAGPACVIPPGGSYTSSGEINYLSRDGSRAFFTAKPTGVATNRQGRVYMREGGTRTTWISASQRSTPDPNGEKPAELAGTSADGSKVFFFSCEKLTDDSTAFSTAANECSNDPGNTPVQGRDLYSYDVDTGQLTDLTVDSNASDPLGASVRMVLSVSSDGSYVYFIADGVLAPGASQGGSIYVYHDGTTTFIAKEAAAEEDLRKVRVSANGAVLLFGSHRSLTGYDNHNNKCGFAGQCLEFFRYSAPEEKLTCISCIPTGAPSGETVGLHSKGQFIGGEVVNKSPSRNLSASGNRIFFESGEALVPSDTNGARDVYEWEAKGEGSCESESQNGGCLYLISSGTSLNPSTFVGASNSGDHVFFLTDQQLVPTDEDQLYDVYDAGTGAGLATQHTLSPPSCSSTACQANPPPPPDPSLASAAYSGAGNEHRPSKARKCPQGKRKVRTGGKTRCQKAHKQHKRHDNRGGSK